MDNIFALNDFDSKKFDRYILAVDVGGENTYFGILGIESKKNFVIIKKYHSKTKNITNLANNINKVLEDVHREFDIVVSRGIIAGAGVPSRKRSKLKLTNTDLLIDINDLKSNTLLLKYILLNDFEAEGYGLDFIKSNLEKLNNVSNTNEQGTYLLIGAGKGLGISIAHYDFSKHLHIPFPSEAGHLDFAPSNYFELELKEFIKQKNHREVTYEDLVSSKGLHNIYDFLNSKKLYDSSEVAQKINNLDGDVKLREIENNQHDLTCKMTIELFVKFYAKFARNMALTCIPYSGLFLSGQVTINLNDQIKHKFMEEFLSHETHSDLLQKIPIYFLNDENLALLGACNVAINFYNIMN